MHRILPGRVVGHGAMWKLRYEGSMCGHVTRRHDMKLLSPPAIGFRRRGCLMEFLWSARCQHSVSTTCSHVFFGLHSPRIIGFPCCAATPRCQWLPLHPTVVDYDAVRKETASAFEEKIVEVRGLVSKLQKTQRAAEQALDQYEKSCAA